MNEAPVRIGMMLYTLVEPHPGRHRAYNRWYERDHFYSGVLTLPGTLAGQRWVATPRLKARRVPAASPIVPDGGQGSFLSTYFVDADRIDEWDLAASQAVGRLGTDGRLFPQRDHVLTRFFDFERAQYRDADPVPATLTLDHRYPGLVTVVGRAADDASGRTALLDRLADDVIPAALPGTPVASVLTFTVRPFTGERPADLPIDSDPPTRFLQLWFVEADPDVVWDAVFASLPDRLAGGGALLEWMGGFVPTVPGTDAYVDLLEAPEH